VRGSGVIGDSARNMFGVLCGPEAISSLGRGWWASTHALGGGQKKKTVKEKLGTRHDPYRGSNKKNTGGGAWFTFGCTVIRPARGKKNLKSCCASGGRVD